MSRVFMLSVAFLLAPLSLIAQSADLQAEPAAIIPDALEARDVEVSRFGTYIAIYDLSEVNTIRVFSRTLGQLWKYQLSHYWPGSVPAGSALAFSPDEQLLLFPGYRTDTDICVCEASSGTPRQVLLGHENDVSALALSPDGRHLISASSSELVLWRRQDGEYSQIARIDDHGPAVQSIAFLPDGERFLTSSREERKRAVTLFSIADGTIASTSEYSLQDNNISYDIRHLTVTPDGRWIAAGYREDLLFFQTDGGKLQYVDIAEDIELGVVTTVASSPDSRFIVSGHFGYLRWWRRDGSRWVAVATTATQQPGTLDLAFSATGDRLFLASSANENAITTYALTGIEPSATGRVAAVVPGTLSAEQRHVLTPQGVEQIVSEVGSSRFAARDMFETAAEYEARLAGLRASVTERIIRRIEDQYRLSRRTTGPDTSEIEIPLSRQGSYDIDARRYDLSFLESRAWVQLPRDAARDLYRNWQAARVVATLWETEDGVAVGDFRLRQTGSHPDAPLVLEQNPFTGEALNTAQVVVPSIPVGPDLMIRDLELDAIFPALRYAYAHRPIGRFVLENTGSGIIGDLTVSFSLDRLGASGTVDIPRSIAAGSTVTAELVTGIGGMLDEFSQGGTTTLTMQVEYDRGRTSYTESFSRQVRILSENAIQWDDDQKVAAFVDAGSPEILKAATRITGTGGRVPTPVLTRNFISAVELFAALREQGIAYVVDPNSAYRELSGDSLAVDYVRFPLQTLAAGGGDCDDLSVLYAALLESSGISTAFITTPGHLFLAFDTGVSPTDAVAFFESPESYIVREGSVWLPVESTLVSEGFVRAWQTGVVQWQQAENAGVAGFFTTRAAWSRYEPAPQPDAVAPEMDTDRLHDLAAIELTRFRDLELEPKLRSLDPADESAASQTRRGTLLASYGLFNEARAAFLQATAERDHVAALVNLSNLSAIEGRNAQAREYLERAATVEPENPRVLMGLAFLYWASGERENARSAYSEASRLNPALARRFPLFTGDQGNGARAASGTQLFNLDWADALP